MHLPVWLSGARLRYQGVSYWVVPWDTTQAKAGVEAEPDDGRSLGGAFAPLKLSVIIPSKAVL